MNQEPNSGNDGVFDGGLDHSIFVLSQGNPGSIYPALDLARVENSNPGHGEFKALLTELELRVAQETETLEIYVECVHNVRLKSFLVKQWYTTKSDDGDFKNLNLFKILRKEDSNANAL